MRAWRRTRMVRPHTSPHRPPVLPASRRHHRALAQGDLLRVTRRARVSLQRRAAHAAEIGAAGGISNGRGLARLYAPLANGVTLVRGDILARMGAVESASKLDASILAP